MRLRPLALLAPLVLAAACGSPDIHVLDPMGVVNWSPHDGARDVELDWAPGACLSRPLDEGTLGEVTLHLGAVDGEAVAARVELSETEPACFTFREATLDVATDYVMVLGPGLAARDGSAELGQTLQARFRTIEE